MISRAKGFDDYSSTPSEQRWFHDEEIGSEWE